MRKLSGSAASPGDHSSAKNVDFDEEGRALWARLNLDKSLQGGRHWNALDPIWKHPTTGGTIYVGNQSAAENLKMLQSKGITHVVNCTAGQASSQIPNYHERTLRYYRFPISYWSNYVRPNDDASVQAFLNPVFEFIDSATNNGDSVLVHCLAGAHRAGTTGILCLMNYADLDPTSATRLAKQCRAVIDPIAHLPELMHRFHRIKQNTRDSAAGEMKERKREIVTISSSSSPPRKASDSSSATKLGKSASAILRDKT
mmetsp:Transcript_23966/g.24207  ORF Transcript_23966/g.24207 Transcript_23966/m.24207 type:complete len:257 (+) Transcript_23966:67-837(+)|eukprot:CAMPEP_0182427444 /NCGR_PEP_ID=MMETSP1167-20130531/17180_1 /TAXON_ID=2988 /ORGANISM="Mallomonas Sp, Strain CCMP3275" /LENGTH=256 /DNA_ID=CAMNT_0024609677 /DNA_START=66 /DNA_END=836 /DNA_ORIENTATION=+